MTSESIQQPPSTPVYYHSRWRTNSILSYSVLAWQSPLLLRELSICLDDLTRNSSRTSRALAKAGLKVAHIDPNAYYGGDEATLTLDEVIAWAKQQSLPDHTHQNERCTRYDVEFLSEAGVSHPRQYTISLSPSVIPAVGPFITSITASSVARYASFKLLGSVSIYHDGHFENVPRGKEDVFRDQQIPLVEKRRLMRFLMFAAGEYESSPEFQGKEDVPFLEFLCQTFSLSENIAQIVAFALAYCNSADGESFLSRLN